MTPEARALAAAFLAECWAPVADDSVVYNDRGMGAPDSSACHQRSVVIGHSLVGDLGRKKGQPDLHSDWPSPRTDLKAAGSLP